MDSLAGASQRNGCRASPRVLDPIRVTASRPVGLRRSLRHKKPRHDPEMVRSHHELQQN